MVRLKGTNVDFFLFLKKLLDASPSPLSIVDHGEPAAIRLLAWISSASLRLLIGILVVWRAWSLTDHLFSAMWLSSSWMTDSRLPISLTLFVNRLQGALVLRCGTHGAF